MLSQVGPGTSETSSKASSRLFAFAQHWHTPQAVNRSVTVNHLVLDELDKLQRLPWIEKILFYASMRLFVILPVIDHAQI